VVKESGFRRRRRRRRRRRTGNVLVGQNVRN